MQTLLIFLSWSQTSIQGAMDIQRVPKIPETNVHMLLPGCAPPIWGVFSVRLYCTSECKALAFSFFLKDASYTWHVVTLGKEERNPISPTRMALVSGPDVWPSPYPQALPSQKGSGVRSSPTTNLCLPSPKGFQRTPFCPPYHTSIPLLIYMDNWGSSEHFWSYSMPCYWQFLFSNFKNVFKQFIKNREFFCIW